MSQKISLMNLGRRHAMAAFTASVDEFDDLYRELAK